MRRRSGFSLVEVLVALALILFIMSILAAAFGAATQAVSDLKAAGDLAEKLRGAATVLKRDLEADHCFDVNGNVLPLPLVFDTQGGVVPNPPPPTRGFLRIYQGQADTLEGNDLDGLPSYYQTTAALHYTITLPSRKRRQDFLSALVPAGSPLLNPADTILMSPDTRYQDSPNVYSFPTAEVAVFLVRNPDVTDGAPALPLYALYRRQLVTVPDQPPPQNHWAPAAPVPAYAAGQPTGYPEVSTNPMSPETPTAANLTFNSTTDLTMPVKRFGMDRGSLAGVYNNNVAPALNPAVPPSRYPTMGESNPAFKAADLLMTDVVSFDVRVLVDGSSTFEDLFQLTNPARTDPRTGNLWYYPYNNPNTVDPATTQAARVFDTWSSAMDPTYDYSAWMTPNNLNGSSIPIYKDNGANGNPPKPISIKAIQITLRVWDFKTKKTRQVTVVQQM
jgi:prepilin-type N-terminal cleavage/methylation domain-containing protein